MLETLIVFATFDLKCNQRKFQPPIAVSREKLKVNRVRRASSNAETALDRAAHHRGGKKVPIAAARHRRPSWFDFSMGAPVKDYRDMKAPSTTSLSREFEFDSQMRESSCFQEPCIGENNWRRERAMTCPVSGTKSMVGETGVANELGGSMGSGSFDAATLFDPESADDLEYRVSSLLNDKSWDEVSESCVSSDLDTAAQTEMMRCATTGAVGGQASEEFSAYLQRAFEAEQQLDEMREMVALDTIPEEAEELELELEPLQTTMQIREKARNFLRELQENPLPDLKDLVDGFTSLDEMFDSSDQEVCRLAEVGPFGVETSAASAMAVLHTNSGALELMSQELSMLLSKRDLLVGI